MAWVTPVTDRAQSDIDNRTSKAFLNTTDWTRIYGNVEVVNDLVEGLLGLTIIFDTIATPTGTTIPTITDLNKLTGNIERVRLIALVAGTEHHIKDDWEAGADKQAPNFRNVNLWENTLLLIYTAYNAGATTRRPVTGVAASGRSYTLNHKWR